MSRMAGGIKIEKGMVRPARFERTTACLEGRCSIQLSYGRNHDHTTGGAPTAQAGMFVIARHEIALQPGLALWEAFHDPKDGKVKLDGENAIEFPKLPEFHQVTLKVLRWEEKDKRFVIKEAELVT